MHLPGHLRARFATLAETSARTGAVPATVACGDDQMATSSFLRSFIGCTDRVPAALAGDIAKLFRERFGFDLHDRHVGAYAAAARRLSELRREHTSLNR